MRVKIDYRTGSLSVYKEFCKKFPEVDLSYAEWRQVIYTYNEGFRDYMLDTGEQAKVPWGLGSFAVSKKKIRKSVVVNGVEHCKLPIDWPKTLKAGKWVHLLNAHTDGYGFRWLWMGGARGIPHGDTWFFKAARTSSRLLARYLKAPNSSYSQLYKEWEAQKYKRR